MVPDAFDGSIVTLAAAAERWTKDDRARAVSRFLPRSAIGSQASWQPRGSRTKAKTKFDFSRQPLRRFISRGSMRALNYEQSLRIFVRGGLTLPLDAVDLAVS
jgi:hypothetical protein